ncbi:unnamed protein product [Arctia plantaginis]|uniref:Uncharacterized protein n=1 Tax=Arctia plantaginis TaxID=874455 RepID=A0A8S1AVI2_ARCPL|nr:unnamed protein product [Arctia plantaginis]CAB3249196.1 unnamed protein product [Arctia plantaginis]
MLFATILPWVVVLHMQRDNSSEMETRIISRTLSEDLMDLCTYDGQWNIRGDERGLEISVKVPRGGKITTLKPNEGSEGTTTELWGEKEITENSPLPILVTDKPLSEKCMAYRRVIESVLHWAHHQLDKLGGNEMSDVECEASIPTKEPIY